MASKAYLLARAGESSTLARVTQVLDGFAARDREGEMLTAVRHYPAREAQWAEFPEWVHADLRAAYNAKGIRATVHAPGGGCGSGTCGQECGDCDADGFGEDAVLQPAGAERDSGE